MCCSCRCVCMRLSRPSQHGAHMLTGCCNECALVGLELFLHQIRKPAVGLKLDVPSDNGKCASNGAEFYT